MKKITSFYLYRHGLQPPVHLRKLHHPLLVAQLLPRQQWADPGRPAQTPEQIAAAKANADALNADRQNMMDQLHIKFIRSGKNGIGYQCCRILPIMMSQKQTHTPYGLMH